MAIGGAFASLDGFDLVVEEEGLFLEDEDGEGAGFLYMGVPDQAALAQILSLWKRYKAGEEIGAPHRQWNALFSALHDIRRWGPEDRVSEIDRELIANLAFDGQPVNVELELAFYRNIDRRAAALRDVKRAVEAAGGEILKTGFVPQIAYHAVLVRVPAQAAMAIARVEEGSLAFQPDIFAVRPQSLKEGFDVELGPVIERPIARPDADPILAVLDGVPVTAHDLLRGRVVLEDPDDLSRLAVGERDHGTAMLSLAVWGDLNSNAAPLQRPVVARPLTYAPEHGHERFPDGSLVVDDLVRAIRGLVDEDGLDPAAYPTIRIVNLSLGDKNRPFFGRLSPWARAVDWLAYRYGLLFIISAGNVDRLEVASAQDSDAYAVLQGEHRSRATLGGMRDAIAHRTLLAPGEAVNALTVGATHEDAMDHPHSMGVDNHNPMPGCTLPSPVTRSGPGFRKSIKPDIVMPGGRLRARADLVARPAMLRFPSANRFGGLQVAGPDGEGTAWSGATSGAAALASRGAHLIYDALAQAHGDEFLRLGAAHQSLIVKSLLVHRTNIPSDGRELVEEVFGPAGSRLSFRRKNNVLRMFGYGKPNIEESMACVNSRATIWGYGQLGEDQGLVFNMPVPATLLGNNQHRRITTTLSWFSPVSPGLRQYKAVRLKIEEPSGDNLRRVGIEAQKGQAPRVTGEAGSTFHRCWEGKVRTAADGQASISFKVSRQPDTNAELPDLVPFGIVASVEAPGADLPVYEQVRERLRTVIQPRPAILVP